MIRRLSNHTCISMSLEFNLHLTTPFPAMNKTLPSDVVDTEQSSKIGTNKSCVDAELSSDNGDLTRIHQAAHTDVGRVSDEFSLIAAQLLDTLQDAVMKRVTLINQDSLKHCGMYYQSEQKELSHDVTYNQATTLNNARIAILFSGGVDSMVLAALADRQV